MTNFEREMVEKLMIKSISETEFINGFTVDIIQNRNYVKELLEEAYNNKDADDVDYSLFIGFSFNQFREDYLNILCKLIESSWHFQHENIARILQKLKSPNSIESLYKTALLQFDYLDFDESYALAVKCIWALGDINTIESRKKLEMLSLLDNEIIRDNAIKQLTRDL